MIQLKRVYDLEKPDDGARYLVERLWPRGIKKELLHLNAWLKDVAPSTELRRWYGHDLRRWKEFKQKYRTELRQKPDAWKPILDAARKGNVTLLYSAHDTEHNSALLLKEFLEKTAAGKRG